MAYDGNGNFNRLYNWQDDAANGINIMADRMDAEMDGFANGLSTAFLRDGQAAMQADADIGNFRLLRVANPTLDTDGVNKKWIDDNFLSSSGNTTISGPNPGIIFEEDDQISDLNKWRIKVAATDFIIEPLQTDGSEGDGFGELRMRRDLNGMTQFDMNGGDLTINKDERENEPLYLSLTANEQHDITMRFRHQTPLDDASYKFVLGARAKGTTPLNGTINADSQVFRMGNEFYDTMEFLTESTGRFDFFNGTGTLDASINSNGLFVQGSDGIVTNNAGNFGVDFDQTTLTYSKGVRIDHNGSNAAISNLDVGDIAFRFGGSGQANTVAAFDSTGKLTVNTLDSTGNVLIGAKTTEVSRFLDVATDSGYARGIRIADDGGTFRHLMGSAADGEFFFGTTVKPIGFRSSGAFFFMPGGASSSQDGARLKIDADGNLEIGTHRSWGGFEINTTSGQNVQFNTKGDESINFQVNGQNRTVIGNDGSVTVGAHQSGGGLELRHNNGDAFVNNKSGSAVRVQIGGTTQFSVNSGGNIVSVPTYNETNSSTSQLVRVAASGTFQRSTSLASTKRNMQSFTGHTTPGETIDALSPIIYEAKEPHPGEEGQLYAGFTVEDMIKNYPVAVLKSDPTDYDIKAVLALAIAELQDLRARVALVEAP